MSTQPTTLQAPPDRPRPIWSRKSIVVPLTVSILIFGWLYGQTVVQSIRTFATDTWHCLTTECNPTGPAASWQDQFTVADTAAHKIDPDAVLTNITASPAAYKARAWQTNDALEVSFNYVMTNGGSLDITFWDTAPQNIWIDRYDDTGHYDLLYYNEYFKRKADIAAVLARITISPRQAIDSTSTAARALDQLKGISIQPNVGLHFVADPVPADKWHVRYWPYIDGPGNVYEQYRQLQEPMYTVKVDTGTTEYLHSTSNP